MLPVFSDRRTDWPSHPFATRDSLHEHDMWAVEGLTHRYPTKVLAEMLPTCPQYCGHCTRMDLVGNSTPQFTKLKLAGKPVDRYAAMLDYLHRTPGVRDVVVSGGDVANMPWKNLEGFLDKLLEVDTIRDIRLATKALMGLPQHWLQDDVVEGVARVSRQGPLARCVARDPHPRQQRPVGHPARGAGLPGHARRRGARRAQPGRAHARGQRLPRGAARPVLRPAGRGDDHALLLLHVRHDPVRRALAALAQGGPGPAARDHGLPARVRDPAHRLRRAVRRQALGAPGRDLRDRARDVVLAQELPHLDRGRRRPGAVARVRLLRPDLHAPRGGAALVARDHDMDAVHEAALVGAGASHAASVADLG